MSEKSRIDDTSENTEDSDEVEVEWTQKRKKQANSWNAGRSCEDPQPSTSAQALKELTEQNERYRALQKTTDARKRGLPHSEPDNSAKKRPRNVQNTVNSNNTRVRVPKNKKRSFGLLDGVKRDLANKLQGKFDYEQASGVIKSLKLYNFMCHSSFYKEWHPNMNFVTGENGSGKSALLSGILVGLGAKANATSRTKSITNLIQSGKDHAKTEITLLNANATLSVEKYGKQITIERIISLSGASQYKIKCKGSSRPLSRSELDFILLSLDIQIENPLMILNQEAARSFLRSKDPKDKYRLFNEGTMMSTLWQVLSETQQNVDLAVENVKNFQMVIKTVEETVQTIRQDYQKLQELEKAKETVDKIRAEYLWSTVVQMEKKKEEKELQLQAETVEVEKYESNYRIASKKRDEILEKPTDAEEDDNAKRTLRSKELELEQVRSKSTKLRNQVNERKARLHGCDRRIDVKRERMEECKSTVEKIQRKAKEMEEKVNKEFSDKKEALDGEKTDALNQLKSLKQDAEQFRHGADSLRKEMDDLQDKVHRLNNRKDKTQRDLELLRKSTSNKYSVFGKEMEELVAKINAQESRFRKKPLGPIGAFCTVKDPKWVNLVEFVLRNLVTAFVVDNGNDLATFKEIMNTVYRGSESRPTILVSQFTSKAFDITSGEARIPDIPTLLDLIEIENNNHTVFNVLCDFGRAEQILMFPDQMEAMHVIGNQHKCPPTCIGAFTLDFYNVTPHPHYSVMAQRNDFRASFLKSSSRAQTRELRNRSIELQNELAEIKPILDQKTKEEAHLRSESNKRTLAINAARKKVGFVESQIQMLTQKQNYAPDIVSQLEELAHLTKEYEEQIDEKERDEKFLEENQPSVTKLLEQKQKLQADIIDLENLIASFVERSDTRQTKLLKIDNMLARITSVLKKRKSEQSNFQKGVDSLVAQIQAKLEIAENVCPRIATEREPVELEKELESMKQTIEESHRFLGSKEQIEQKYKKSMEELNVKQKEYDSYKALITMITSVLDIQLQGFDQAQISIGNQVSSCFFAMATSRGYDGSLLVDHQQQELFYYVCPDKDSEKSTQDAMKAASSKITKKKLIEYSLGLSGGERSFATICFIIAMWQVMGCPFFMLDEFDVFMDPFNRKTSQTALMSHAKRFKAHQFFFFTPLDLTQVPSQEEACILRMFPPIRNAVPDRNDLSPTSSVGEVENTDPKSGGRSQRAREKAQPGTINAMREKNSASAK